MSLSRFTTALLFAACAAAASAQTPLGTAFTYQGKLESNGNPASGSHDMRFTLYDAPSGGNVIAGPICADNANVVSGLFSLTLDFGSANATFNGDARWLAIEVRPDSA